jgi:nucleoside-diphosphate-sugar epimerase
MSTLLPKAGPVLITAVNGYISSNVASCFLSHGYTVIGTVRSLDRHAWLQRLFDAQYPGLFSLVELADIGDDAALESIIQARGVVSVILTTSLIDASQTTPEPYVSKSVDIALASLRAVSRCPAVQSVVVTSSAWAVATPHVDVREVLTESDYNEEAIRLVYDEVVTDPTYRGFLIIMAANVKKEKAMWDFVGETKPSWRFNTLLVDTVFGNIVSVADQGFPSTASLLNGPEAARAASFYLTPQWFVDVQDVAKLHVAAATRTDISSERIFAYGQRYTWKAITGILQNCRPEAEWTTGINENEGECLVEVPNERGADILRSMGHAQGWTDLKTSVRNTVRDHKFAEQDPAQVFVHKW